MSRASGASGDSNFNNQDGFATRHNLWAQRQEFNNQFERLEHRLDDTFREFEYRERQRQEEHHAQFQALHQAIANLGNRHGHRSSSSSSSRTRSSSRHGESSRSHSRRGEPHHHNGDPQARHRRPQAVDPNAPQPQQQRQEHGPPPHQAIIDVHQPQERQDEANHNDRRRHPPHDHHEQRQQHQEPVWDTSDDDEDARQARRNNRHAQHHHRHRQAMNVNDADQRRRRDFEHHPENPPQQPQGNQEPPPPPPRPPSDASMHQERRNNHHERDDGKFGKLKFVMPKFKGEENADAYLEWELKVDKIFRVHNFSEEKKVAMASLEFEDYANVWWEDYQSNREKQEEPPVTTWTEMKNVMYARFVPEHYRQDLFDKLQNLKQGTKTIEEFYKEMEMTMMRADVKELEEQTIARFLNGLSRPIRKIVDFQPYKTLVNLLHQATKAERHLQKEHAYEKQRAYYASLNSSNPSKPTNQTTSSSKQSKTPMASTSNTTTESQVVCYKCGGKGHKSYECINTRVMLTDENGATYSVSEDEFEAMTQAAITKDAAMQDEDTLLCEHDSSPSLVIAQVLTTNSIPREDQRLNIFQTRAGIDGKSIKVIIDGGSCHNLASIDLCEKLKLPYMEHPHPYHVKWLDDNGTIQIKHKVNVSFKIGPYQDTVECDVVPMTVCHMLLGRPWQYDKGALHDGTSNQYSFKWNDKTLVLQPMTPSQIITSNMTSLPKIKQAKDPCEMSGERVIHQHVSECYKPQMSGKIMSATSHATTREKSDLSVTNTNNPSYNSFSLLSVLQDTQPHLQPTRNTLQDLQPHLDDKLNFKIFDQFEQGYDTGDPTTYKLKTLRTPSSLYDDGTSSRTTRFEAGGDDAAQHMAFTIGPHHATSTIPSKVNSFHISPSFGYHVNGILLETSAHAMTRPMTMTPRGDDKKTPETKTPKQEAWKRRRKKLRTPDRSLRPSHRSLRTTPEFLDRPPVRTQEPSPGQPEAPFGDGSGD